MAKVDPNRTEKRCACCRLVKPITDFTNRRATADGRHCYCRPCSQIKKYGYNESKTTEARLWAGLDKRGPDECWEWTRARNKDGYGILYVGGKLFQDHPHRIMWGLVGNEMPAWPNVIDHICRNRACANPAHLRVVTQAANCTVFADSNSPWAANAKKTHCIRGHPLSGENLRINERGHRECRACATLRPSYIAARVARQSLR